MQYSFRTVCVSSFAAIALMATPLMADGGSGPDDSFIALSGKDAAVFKVPSGLFVAGKQFLAPQGLTKTRYQQRVGEAEVLGGQLTIVTDQKGRITSVVGAYYPEITPQNQVRLSSDQAQAIAANRIGAEGEWHTTLMISPTTGRYFFRVENRRFDNRWFHWIDAENGEVINAYDGLTSGSGTGVNGDTKDLTGLTTQNASNYVMVSSDGRQTTYDAKNRSRLPGKLAQDIDDLWTQAGRTSPGQPALVDAQFYARVTDDYYSSTHGFDWTDFYPQGMVSSAHYKRNYVNAFWNGTQMAYGDGDGVDFVEMSGDLDVVAHELSHGVTEATSNLIYQNESGALNEAFSDIMGTAAEFYNHTGNWTIGEDIMPNDDGIRNMADPEQDGQPSHYDERYKGASDNGGVHTNSGIANHWFYLLVNGGQNSDSDYASGTNVVGIGLSKAQNIAFLGFTALPETATFCQARAATKAVAGGSAANVADAWDEVGVDVALCGQ